jgi:16S rRNA (cytosine1402-N4)-methyltransferase
MMTEIENIIKKYSVKNVVDCTFGAGGHTNLFLNNNCKVVAFDQDSTVMPYVNKIDNSNFKFILDNFANISVHLNSFYDLIFADLGISTMQLNSSRGFSYLHDSPLNMSMNNSNNLEDIINSLNIKEIESIIWNYGQEPMAKKIAININNFKLHENITTTFQLRKAIGIDNFSVLSRVFQAFRIFLNEEMDVLETLLKNILNYTNMTAFLTFHSLEDLRVKNFFKTNKMEHFLLNPSAEEIQVNSKARSAKLRFGIKQISI